MTWERSENKLTPLTRPIPTQGAASGVGMTDAVKLAHRLPRDRRERAGWEIREAVGVTEQTRDCTQRHIVRHLLPAQGLGVPCAFGINDRRVTHNMCCVNVSEANRRPRRAGTSTVAGDVPSCQPRERSRLKISPGHFVSGTVAPAQCQIL